MTMDYVAGTAGTGTPAPSILRLYEFTSDEVAQLVDVFRQLSDGRCERFTLNDLPFISPDSECRLVLKRGKSDVGVLPAGKGRSFTCELTPGSWRKAAESALQVRRAHPGTYQWLYDLLTPVEFLLSVDGGW